jgi:hypothetical protein
LLLDIVRGSDEKARRILLQSVGKDFCFHKGLIAGKVRDYNK